MNKITLDLTDTSSDWIKEVDSIGQFKKLQKQIGERKQKEQDNKNNVEAVYNNPMKTNPGADAITKILDPKVEILGKMNGFMMQYRDIKSMPVTKELLLNKMAEVIDKSVQIKAPNEAKELVTGKTIFLAGSIDMGETEDWQEKLWQELKDDYDVTIYNPRRNDWDSSWKQDIDNPEFNEQVNWELNHQKNADIIAMYFAPESKAPISLLELGLFADTGKMIVCCPEGFYRKGNVDIVCKKYGVEEVDNWGDFVKGIKNKLSNTTIKKQSRSLKSTVG